MARRHFVCPHLVGNGHKSCNLNVAVARHAGTGRPSRKIGIHKRIQHLPRKSLIHGPGYERDSQRVAELLSLGQRLFGRHRDIALLHEQCGCHYLVASFFEARHRAAGVHPAREAYHHPHERLPRRLRVPVPSYFAQAGYAFATTASNASQNPSSSSRLTRSSKEMRREPKAKVRPIPMAEST